MGQIVNGTISNNNNRNVGSDLKFFIFKMSSLKKNMHFTTKKKFKCSSTEITSYSLAASNLPAGEKMCGVATTLGVGGAEGATIIS